MRAVRGAIALAGLLATATVPAIVPPRPALKAAPARDTGTRLILLGTGGGPLVRTRRSEAANLLVVDGRPYLIDVGSGTVHRLKEAGFAAADVERVFLTHLHFDHTGGLASLLGFRWSTGAGRAIDIYGPTGTKALVDGALQYLRTGEELYAILVPQAPGLAQMTRSHEVEPSPAGPIFQDDKVRVYAVENSHYATIPAAVRSSKGWRSYSLRFETPDKVVVFTGDTGPSDAVAELARGADILVSEVIDVDATVDLIRGASAMTEAQRKPLIDHMLQEHLTPENVGKLAQKAGVRKVVLSHFSPGLDEQASSGAYVRGVRRYFHGAVVAGRDLDRF